VDIPAEYGLVVAMALALYLQQTVLFVIPVIMQRRKTGIAPPTLYPTDSQIKELKLTSAQVDGYLRAQRVHQNNLEFLPIFYPMMLLAGLHNPLHTFYAAIVVFLGRLAFFIGYNISASARVFGGFFHLGEFYILYLVGSFAYSLIQLSRFRI